MSITNTNQTGSEAAHTYEGLTVRNGLLLVNGTGQSVALNADASGSLVANGTRSAGVYRVEDYGAVADSFYTDGSATSSSTTFTSASAGFTPSDVGKTIVILRAGVSNQQDHHTTIASVDSATQVQLTNAASRTQASCRFYISRGGDSTAAIQAAIDAAGAAGGGTVLLQGAGYLVSGLVLKNRVWLEGAGMRSTIVHMVGGGNQPVVRCDYTQDNAASAVAIRNIWLDGNNSRAVDVTTTMTAGYTAGQTTLTVADNTNLLPSGIVQIGSVYYAYTGKSGTTSLTGFGGGVAGTTDTNQSNGATVTQKPGGIYLAKNPYSSGGSIEETYDAHHLVENVLVKNCRGIGVQTSGQSSNVCRNVWAMTCFQWGFHSSYDSNWSDCVADTCGLAGYLLNHADIKLTGCKAFFCGAITGSQGWGFILEGQSPIDEGIILLSACSAQDNKADGYWVRNCDHAALVGCGASSNGTSSIGAFVGVKITNSTNCTINVVCTERVASPNNAQQNAVSIDNTSTANQIWVGHSAAGGSTVGPAIASGSNLTAGNNVLVSSMGGCKTQAPGVGGTMTPDPYAATKFLVQMPAGNITVAAPTNAHLGCPLIITIIQDGVGSRTVTWNATYKFSGATAPTLTTTASRRDTFVFRYNGSNWEEESRTLNVG